MCLRPHLSPELLDRALRLTAERLYELDAPQEALVVCGGSALLALGLVQRTTKDVDVLAGVDPQAGLVDPRPLTTTEEEMLAAARWVMTQDASEGFPTFVKEAVTQIGFPHVSAQL